jgi:hypothetical protein
MQSWQPMFLSSIGAKPHAARYFHLTEEDHVRERAAGGFYSLTRRDVYVWLFCIYVLVFNVFCSYHNWSHWIMQGIERHEYIWKDFYSPYLIGSTNIGDCSSDFLSCECAASSIYGSFYPPNLRAQRHARL